jgi:hypothetical protein
MIKQQSLPPSPLRTPTRTLAATVIITARVVHHHQSSFHLGRHRF